ncbi:MAG: hypothetical protein PX640_13470 [Microcystis sp. M49629_WE12]|nr:hypothetical protein [Microcystis sp. M49629_WE12]
MFNLVHLNFIGRLNQLVIRSLAKIKNCRAWLGDSETGDSETAFMYSPFSPLHN